MGDRRRLQVWTPLPPQRTGVADHNAALLEELAKITDVSVVVEDDLAAQAHVPEGVALVRRSEADRHPDDLAVYHMGNHHGLHRWIHDALVARPGIVVLHDPSLVDFYTAYHGGAPGGLDEEISLNHGRLGHPSPRILAGGAWHVDRLTLQLVRRVVEPSLAVVVHSAWARDVLARQFPHKAIHHIELAAPVVGDRPGGPDMRNRLGWGRDNVVFGMLGGLWWHKRPELGAETFAALHPFRPWARLLVAGRAEDGDAMARMRRVVSGRGLESAVSIVTDVDDEEFTACISACDVVMDLRWPTAGETSATVMRALGAGRPVIVSDLPQYGALDRAFCWPVPPEPR
ncbi:MAG: glycosyl transferase, partial [Actinomycetota bacterium]|nr:glycosyl transferase [Actinomycetota bacterium]